MAQSLREKSIAWKSNDIDPLLRQFLLRGSKKQNSVISSGSQENEEFCLHINLPSFQRVLGMLETWVLKTSSKNCFILHSGFFSNIFPKKLPSSCDWCISGDSAELVCSHYPAVQCLWFSLMVVIFDHSLLAPKLSGSAQEKCKMQLVLRALQT